MPTKLASALIDEARKLADTENQTTRHPDADVLSYINNAGADLVDMYVKVRAWPWIGKTYLTYTTVVHTGSGPAITFSGTPAGDYSVVLTITTNGSQTTAIFKYSINGGSDYTTGQTAAASVTLGNTGIVASFAVGSYTTADSYTTTVTGLTTLANQATYELPSDFYKVHSILVQNGGSPGPYEITELGRQDEALLRTQSTTGAPVGFMLTGSRTGANMLTLFPKPSLGLVLRINYYPRWTDFTATTDSFDDINGWSTYLSVFAARRMALKDESFELADRLKQELRDDEKNITSLLHARSTTAPRIQNVRATKIARQWRRYWP